ncbi:efflux RND transporter permease subunit [Brumicola pallidula]|uniref:Cobalt-zinc-cadmium resistance protein czcA n=1 Tax=Brumicola pallidula DSM 14239 = ACAM 615 TaxID=1121922 RepID=K6ZHI1_9ALTE|nr:CusA/CzcA family heavy metal efflux RND transporter [Glaciecola pallidula]GAC29797.1 cobalt-zinc-cadmium resistance protein czcA [Glaciecola pallidula DSM 14239 = ACAM 615]
MLNKLIDWSVTNRLLVIIALVALTASALFMIPKLNLDAFPDVTNIQVTINTEAPGLASEEVEQLITFPIEAVMYALPDVEEVRSISKTGLSGITVVFKEGTDIYFARSLVFERLQSAREMIPDGVGTPEIGPNTSGLGQVYQYVLLADKDSGYDNMSLRSLNDWVVKLLLMPVDGVTDVLAFGGHVKQYQVNVNPSGLLAYELTLEDVANALDANNGNAGGWYMDRGQEQLVIRGVGLLSANQLGLKEIGQIPLKTINGTVIKVSDVASVEFGSEIRQGAVTMTKRTTDEQGRETGIKHLGEVVSGIVLKRMGSNTKVTIDGIKSRIPLIQQALPDGVTFEPIYDQADLIEKAVSTVTTALVQAFIFIIIVLALFLLNVRAVILVLISIPLSVGMALTLMAYYGLSANLMSLGGLAVAIGMMVDGAVVMVENIFKHLSQPDRRHEGSHHFDAGEDRGVGLRIQVAAREVAKPIFFAVSIIMVVFAPLFSLEGVEGKLFQPMAMSIMLAMVASLMVALIVVPALASFFFQKGISLGKEKTKVSPIVAYLEKAYRASLSKAMQSTKAVLIGSVSLLVAALLLVTQLGTEFVPELEEGTINLRATMAPSTSLETALSVAPKLEKILMTFPEVTYTTSRIGRAEVGGDPEPVSNIEIYIGLKDHKDWVSASTRQELQILMEQKLEQFPGLLLNFSQPIATRVDELLSGVKAQLAIKLFGPDLDVLAQQGQAIVDAIQGVEGARDIAMEQIAGESQLVVMPNRQQLSRYGLSVSDVMELVRDGIGGRQTGQVINGNERYDIYLRLAKEFREDQQAISNLRLQAPSGAWVRLGDVADISIQSGPPQVRRDDVQRRVVIQANVQDRDMGSVVTDIQQAIKDKVDLPTGYSVDIGGQFENQQRAQQRLAIVVPLSIAMIALLLYFAFGSVGQAALILVNLPLAMIGGIVALYISGQYLSVPSSIGFITLFGVAVLNGVVMVESINLRVERGTDNIVDSIYEGAISRLRPVLMTAITTALGLIPMILSSGAGAEIQRPLAIVIVGGLVSATFLTLFVLPVLYAWFSKDKIEEMQR